MGLYTEQGVVSRRDKSPDHLINEIREAATKRHTALLADPPTDGTAKPDQIFGGVGWDWNTLLRNRPLDVWMHEQDVRRAVGMPGGMDSPAAKHTADYLAESLGLRARRSGSGAPAGTTVVLEIAGSDPFAFTVNENGRGERLPDAPGRPDRAAADRPRVVHRARRRAAYRRSPASVVVTGDSRPRPADPRHPGGHPVTTKHRPLVALGHAGPGRAGRSWSPAPPAAASATTPRSSSRAAAAG